MSNDFEIPPFHSLVAPSSCMLHWGKHLHTMQRFTSQCRNVCMFLETRLPESLCAADIAKIALSASILINNTWHKRFWELVFEREEGCESFPRLKNNSQVAEWNILLQSLYQIIFDFLWRWTEERQDNHQVQFWNCVEYFLFFEQFVQESSNTSINKFWRVTIFWENFFECFDFFV